MLHISVSDQAVWGHCTHYYLRYNYMFRLLNIAIFRLYMKPYKVDIQDLIWAVVDGNVRDVVGTRFGTCPGGRGRGMGA